MPATKQHRGAITTGLTRLAALCAGTVALAGCGGSSAPQANSQVSTAAAQRSQQTPRQSNPDAGGAQAQVKSAGSVAHSSHQVEHKSSAARSGQDAVHRAGRVQRAQPSPPNDDVNPTGAEPINPCRLVTLSEARSFTGGAVAGRIEAPLGPTCIYRQEHSKSDITLAVEIQNFSKVTHHMQQRKRVHVGDRQAFCGRLGAQMLFVPLPSGQVLNVTAPCAVAQRFAAQALSRLSA